MKLSDDKSAATLELSGTYNADELEELIRRLCITRSLMTPEVPMHPPQETSPLQPAAAVLIEDKPAMSVAQRADGRFHFWLRNRGIGWCGYNVPLAEAVLVYKFMHARLADVELGPDLISKNIGNTH